MNILILNYEYPPLGGGAGIVSQYHAEGLSKLEHNVVVITAWYEGEKEIEKVGHLTIIKLKSKRKYTYKSTPDEWLSWIRISKKFFKTYLQENNFNFCFAHFALPSGEVARFISKKFKIPFAIISHGQDIPWFFPKQMFKYHILTYFWIKHICNKADKLILLTDAMKKNADRFMGKNKYKNIIIPNGCETKTFFPDNTKKSEKLKVIFVGRLVSQKDPFTFLKAINIVQKELGNILEVNILGDGPLLNKMKSFVKNNKLSINIQFKGWVSKEFILQEYQSAHIQVISSKAEAMSIAALESLSSGVYVISTPVSGNIDIIKDGMNGELFPYNDYEILAKKIKKYYRTKFKANYTVPDNFLNNFIKKYDWNNIIKQLNNRVLS